MRDSPPVAAERRRLSAGSRTLCSPVPMTSGGSRSAAATTRPSITTSRRSSPGTRCSISTSGYCARARARAADRSSGPFSAVTPTVMPLPCSPRVGLTTTSPTSLRNAKSPSSKVASRARGTVMPASETRRRVNRLSSHRHMATAEVYSDSDSRVMTLRPPCVSRISPVSASSTSTQIPRRSASSAMIRA